MNRVSRVLSLAALFLINPVHLGAADAFKSPVQGVNTRIANTGQKQTTIAPRSGIEKARVLRLRPYERLPETEVSFKPFGRLLTIGTELSIETEQRRDLAFATAPDDLNRLEGELKLSFFYHVSDYSAAFVKLEGIRQYDEEPEANETETKSQWSRAQMWFYTGGWAGDTLGIQIGRQNFIDDREWWWDKNLDALRIHYDTESVHVEAGIAQQLSRASSVPARIDPQQDQVLRIISSATWMHNPDHEASLFVLLQHDHSETEAAGDRVNRTNRDKSDLDAAWIGVRRQGKFRLGKLGRLYYWLDLGLLAGREKNIDYDSISPQQSLVDSVEAQDLRAAGIDIGAIWKTRLPGEISFTLSFAAGSGDSDLDDGTDQAYRQTGLQGNEGKFRGVSGFHYYGELLRTELSNIGITTLGYGFRFLASSSIDLVFHHYQQLDAADEIRGARLERNPDGNNTEIGTELDLILGIEEWKNLEFDLVFSRFKAGDAFNGFKGETAFKLNLDLSYRF